jgi:nucleotide-binding universal stress UspA family protein
MTEAAEATNLGIQARILIPVGKLVSKQLIMQALHVLSTFKDPLIVLFQVVEIPSRTAALDPDLYRSQIEDSERILRELANWLTQQGLKARTKVAVARSAADGIIEETERGDYLIVFLMKRKTAGGWKRYFARSVSEKVVRHSNCLVLTAPLGHLESHSEQPSKH